MHTCDMMFICVLSLDTWDVCDVCVDVCDVCVDV